MLFFDTYERTGPMLDAWLRDVLVSDRYGQLPANVLVVLAGQTQLDPQYWGDWLDLVTDLPLGIFTEPEARQLLARKGVTDQKITEVILELSGRLPVLVSTLAEAQPSNVADVGDPSGTAVERFLKWEANPVRRAAALASALPQELDEDTYRIVVDEEAREEFGWLSSMPFFINRAGRGHYHDVVRSAMLRLQRQKSPLRWKEQHTRLADAFQQQRIQLEEGIASADDRWEDERWRSYRLQETYHRLCADYRTALPHALRELLDAHDHNITTLRRWVQTLSRAGQDTDAPAVRKWGQDLLTALEDTPPPPGIAALTLLLSREGLDSSGKCLAYILRSWEHRRINNNEQAISDCTTAIQLERTARALRNRGEAYRMASRYEEALADFNHAIELDPDVAWAFDSRGRIYQSTDRFNEAIADFNRAIELECDNAWTIDNRGRTYQLMGRYNEAIADFNRAIELLPDSTWITASRGEAYRLTSQYGEALADFNRTIELDPDYAWANASRGQTYRALGRYNEAIADFNRAIELSPDNAWTIANRGHVLRLAGRFEAAAVDFNRAIELDPDYAWAIVNRGVTYRISERYPEALSDFNRAIEINPHNSWIHYEKTVVLYATQNPEWEVSFSRTIEICSQNQGSIADIGNLFLVHCLISHWTEADQHLSNFLASNPTRGELMELLAVMQTLGEIATLTGERLPAFRKRLEAAISI
ncbi:tetratricopeptide repeat protein [Streptomyces sp. NPDC052292]|uniref:tetratricopeptide repeat protein n=1 Tax=Streptomyces sp. NPDC052292 TaxID=3155053 RepID=UPI003434ECB1